MGASQLDNPYSTRFQTGLTLALCSRLGLRRVLFVGHADGALLALLTTAVAADLRSKQPGALHHRAVLRPAAGYAAWQAPVQPTTVQHLYRSQSEPSARTGMGAALTNRRLPVLFSAKGVTAAPRQQHGSPRLTEPESCPSEPSTPDSRSRGACCNFAVLTDRHLLRLMWFGACLSSCNAHLSKPNICRLRCRHEADFAFCPADSSSSQLTVVIVAPPQPSPSTVSEDDPQSNAELGLLSPMLSPRAASSASGMVHSCCTDLLSTDMCVVCLLSYASGY